MITVAFPTGLVHMHAYGECVYNVQANCYALACDEAFLLQKRSTVLLHIIFVGTCLVMNNWLC